MGPYTDTENEDPYQPRPVRGGRRNRPEFSDEQSGTTSKNGFSYGVYNLNVLLLCILYVLMQ